jgi:hypothetical protein
MKVICFDEVGKSSSRDVADVLFAFARDKPIATPTFRSLAKRSGSSFLIVFRPESVQVNQEEYRPGLVQVGEGTASVLNAELGHASQSVERGYTLLGVLVDLHTGTVVRAGTHRAAAEQVSSMRGPSDVSDLLTPIAVPPPAGPVLTEVMTELLDELLDD